MRFPSVNCALPHPVPGMILGVQSVSATLLPTKTLLHENSDAHPHDYHQHHLQWHHFERDHTRLICIDRHNCVCFANDRSKQTDLNLLLNDVLPTFGTQGGEVMGSCHADEVPDRPVSHGLFIAVFRGCRILSFKWSTLGGDILLCPALDTRGIRHY